jgi:hypothetical protein
MKIKNKIKIVIIIFIGIIVIVGCSKEFDYNKSLDAVKTVAFNNVSQTTVDITGTVLTDNGASLTERGICYSISNNPDISGLKKVFDNQDTTTLGNFTCTLDNLLPNTTYYARAYATNSYGTAYGLSITFKTLVATVPIISSTTSANLITATTAKTGGIIVNSGVSNIISKGVCYSSTVTTPTIADTKTNDGTGIGTFISSLTGLATNTTYYIRAYATNGAGTAYGDIKTFSTTIATIPTGITTTAASTITQTSASSGGNISNDGGASILSKGVCWSNTTSSPTISNSKSIDGAGTGTYLSNISTLSPGTTYYVRAYATNSVGTAYGNTVSFTTVVATIPQGIITTAISSITQTTANSGGSITSDGGSSITMKGVCWSSSTSTPTISNSNTNNGTGTVSFSSSLSSLTANTTYYVRAYALNSVGIAYGNTVTFTTLPTLAVGQAYQGGIIAYIFVSGDSGYVAGQTHGLITTTSNQSTGAQWGCSGTSITVTNTTLGTGLANTTAIVSGCTSTTNAASICNNLSSGGYSDWYLPSYNELNKLYINKTSIGGFSAASYWCSSQSASTTAYSINFSTGTGVSTSTKTTSMYVRAIRAF